MSDAIAPTALVVVPITGEVLDLATTPTDQLAAAINLTRETEVDLRTFKRRVADELLDRMDREATWTVRLGGFEVSGDGPGRTDIDGRRLYEELQGLVMEARITEHAAREAVKVETTYTAVKSKVNKLRKLGGEVAEAIARCEWPSSTPRQVRVKPLV
jgi:hypothetical protein